TKIESSFLFSRISQIILVLFVLARLFAGEFLVSNSILFDYLFNSGVVSQLLLTCCFAWLIVNISLNGNSLIKLENKVFNFLGNISYGVYMYHMLIIFGIILTLKNQLAGMSDVSATILFYL